MKTRDLGNKSCIPTSGRLCEGHKTMVGSHMSGYECVFIFTFESWRGGVGLMKEELAE